VIELLIFDCDGVLVDSEPISNRILHEMLAEVGLARDLEATTREFLGLSMEDCWRIVERKLGRPLPPEFAARYERALRDGFQSELRPVRGVKQALRRIRRPLCVASSGSLEKIRYSLELTGLRTFFEERLFSAAEVGRGKPAPDLFLHAARQLGADPARCVVIEDSPRGVQAGVAARMIVLGYAERTPIDALGQAGARSCFMRMRQLPGLLAML
jgi:HAD superfamily hydrolase (TIGR01509 family)